MNDIIDLTRTNGGGNYSRHHAGWLLIFTATIIILLMVVYFIILTISLINNKFSFYFANDFNLRSQPNDQDSSNEQGVLFNDRPIYIYEQELSKFKKNIEPTAPYLYDDDRDLPEPPQEEEHIYDVPENRQQIQSSPVSYDSEFDSEFDEEPSTSQKNVTDTKLKIYENQPVANENIYLTPKPIQR